MGNKFHQATVECFGASASFLIPKGLTSLTLYDIADMAREALARHFAQSLAVSVVEMFLLDILLGAGSCKERFPQVLALDRLQSGGGGRLYITWQPNDTYQEVEMAIIVHPEKKGA